MSLLLALAACSATARLPPYGGVQNVTQGAVPAPDLVFTLREGARLPARAWLPPAGRPLRAVILALHGFNDSRDAWEEPAAVWAARGIATFAPDQRGFGATADRGRWPGATTLVDDAADVAGQLALRYPGTALYVVGESMGGAVALCLAARPGPSPVTGTVLAAPAVWDRAQLGVGLRGGLWLASRVAPSWRLSGRSVPVRVVASDNRAALLRLARDPLTLRDTTVGTLRGLVDLMDAAQAAAPRAPARMLVLEGAHDQIVPPAAAASFWARLPAGVRRAVYPGGYHLLFRDRDRALPTGDVLAWIEQPGAWLPSGADIAAGAWWAGRSWEGEPAALLPAQLDRLAGDGMTR